MPSLHYGLSQSLAKLRVLKMAFQDDILVTLVYIGRNKNSNSWVLAGEGEGPVIYSHVIFTLGRRHTTTTRYMVSQVVISASI
jgi:hypothetical protein